MLAESLFQILLIFNLLYLSSYQYPFLLPLFQGLHYKEERVSADVYLDKHTTYKAPAQPSIGEELLGIEPLTEFERALGELGV